MKKTLLLITAIFFLTSQANALKIQWETADGGNDHWYEVVLDTPVLDWQNARAGAAAAGGYLATILSAAENNFVWSLVSDTPDPAVFWLGGYQTDKLKEPDGNWAWENGDPWGYQNWATGEPNNGMGETQDYLHFWPSNGDWDDMENGRYMAGYIAEYSTPVPEPATMILLGAGLIGLAGFRRKKFRK